MNTSIRNWRATAPAVPWFESGDLDDYLSRARLDPETEAFVRAMQADGGAVLDLGPDAERLCDQAVAETDVYFDDGKTHRVQDSWLKAPAVRKLAVLPQILTKLKAAYGREPFPFQTLNFKRGSQQHLHSDAIHFSSLPERFMCGVWIALEDVRPEAGPVVYKPGSHVLPIMKMRDVGAEADRPTSDDYVNLYVPRFAEHMHTLDRPETPAMLKKGQAFVWAANLAHGGSAILDPQSTRRSLVVHYYFDGCAYYTPMMSNEARGTLQLRLPSDIRTGLWRWPRKDGKRLPLDWGFVRDCLTNRKPVCF